MNTSLMTRRRPEKSSARPQSAKDFDTLYIDHVDLMHRLAHRLCGEAEAAKDLVQETFLNAYRGLDRFRGDAQISTWLYTIASRVCLRMRRKRKGAPERELSLEEFIPTSDGEFRLQIPIDGLSPEAALHNKQLREALDEWCRECAGAAADLDHDVGRLRANCVDDATDDVRIVEKVLAEPFVRAHEG